ncbi:uridine phosphorylase [Geothermobacter hydrogeniphilus]|uniref:Uridine phosphorylase n=1 Tax=Geothermobacter hydrogeniphilus TaxID=1969733 RepID=A0A2K2HAY6_9BACT|nr:nucleoside phosphorylase [Geothermobacter hydrogeniphilus]PNU20475.1 uridine phosphorylase [Geothermobacter hydrogeniphilus]
MKTIADKSLSALPILAHQTAEPSVFLPENLLAQASSMKGEGQAKIPACCLLDFDGELIAVAQKHFAARTSPDWPCFHTSLLILEQDGFEMGLIGGTVGAPFAVLVCEQLIACGCRHLIGYSSAGAVGRQQKPPFLMVPDRAMRDEGTSYHYLPPAPRVDVRGQLPAILSRQAKTCGLPVCRGTTWTTDAPYRETATQIEQHRTAGVRTVEMEAAALMALAQVKKVEIASLLHVTNTMATGDNDFHKGPDDINRKVIECCLAAMREAIEQNHQ